MIARFGGKCSKCNGYINAGTEVDYNRDTRRIAHRGECPTALPTGPARKDAAVLAQELEAAEAELSDAVNAMSERARGLQERARVLYAEAGGCPRVTCGGRGRWSEWVFDDCWDVTCDDCLSAPAETVARRREVGTLEDFTRTSPSLARERDDLVLARELERECEAKVQRLKEALRVQRGAVVEVVKGRKVPRGTRGEVIWTGRDSWGNYRVGVKDSAGTVHWTAESNVEVREVLAA